MEKRPPFGQPEEQRADQEHRQEGAAKGPEIGVVDQPSDDVVSELKQEQE